MIRVHANAKINLFLKIGPRKKDGFHDILTLFQSIGLADTVTVRMHRAVFPKECGSIRIHVTGGDNHTVIPVNEDNTVHRAWRFLCTRRRDARRIHFDVTIRKRIPVGGGLGGGSADAAAFLVAVARHLRIPTASLRRDFPAIARSVGADVPFCMVGGTAIGRGRGERLRFLPPLPPHDIFVVIPPASISTAEAYAALDCTPERKNLTNTFSARRLYLIAGALRKHRDIPLSSNDFQPVAFKMAPVLGAVAEKLRPLGFSMMSGSGSVFFLIPRQGCGLNHVRSAVPGTQTVQTRFVRHGVIS